MGMGGRSANALRAKGGDGARVEKSGIWTGPHILVLPPTRCLTAGKIVFLDL